MGTFRVALTVGGPTRDRFETVEALVGTGATYTVLPRGLLDDLGVASHTRAPFVLTDGAEVEFELGRAWIRIDGQQECTLVVFGEVALLGAVTLEELRLAPDPVSQRLVPVRALMMQLAA